MGTIGHGHGSEWHLLRYLGYHRHFLNDKVLEVTKATSIEWLDFSFSGRNVKLHDEEEWKGMDFIQDADLNDKWRQYWPGLSSEFQQNWDAIAQLRFNDTTEWLLVEAKAHEKELQSACGAGERSREIIKSAFSETQAASGSTAPIEDWFAPYYQYSNHLAALAFLNSRGHPARLLNIYFCGESWDDWTTFPAENDWKPTLSAMGSRLGTAEDSELMKRVHSLFLDVHPGATVARSGGPSRQVTPGQLSE